MTVTEGNPDVQDASTPQAEPGAPAKTPEQAASDRLFGNKAPAPAKATEEVAAPAPEPAKPSDEPDAKLARLYAQATESEASMRSLEASNKELQSKLKGFADDKAEWDADPYAVLEKRGIDPKEWMRRTLDLDEDPPTPEEIAEEALREVQSLKSDSADRAKQETAQKLIVRTAEIQGHVGKFLKDNGFDALLTSAPAVERITKKIFELEQENKFRDVPADKINAYVQKLAEHYDGMLRSDVNRYVGAQGAIKGLMADEATAKMLREHLAPQPQSEPSGGQVADAGDGAGNEPRTITDNLAGQAGSKTNGSAVWNQNDARRRAAAAVAKGFATDT